MSVHVRRSSLVGPLRTSSNLCDRRVRCGKVRHCRALVQSTLGIPTSRKLWCIVRDPIFIACSSVEAIKTLWKRTFLAWMWELGARAL